MASWLQLTHDVYLNSTIFVLVNSPRLVYLPWCHPLVVCLSHAALQAVQDQSLQIKQDARICLYSFFHLGFPLSDSPPEGL